MSVPKSVALPGGDQIPAVGCGTWTVWEAAPGAVRDAIKAAIAEGYRHVDCAWVYGNEQEVGEAIQDKIKDGTVARSDLFVTTKLWDTAHRRGAVTEQLKKALARLSLDYVDLYLIHWPTSFKEGDIDFPKDDNDKHIFEFHDIQDTWKGMEDAKDAGLTKNIGISNFNSKQVQRVIDGARIKPCNIQIEVNPLFSNARLIDFCRERGLTVTAYAPFGSPNRPWKKSDDPVLFEQPILKDIAAAKGKSPAQVCLRFLLQRGLVVIPKSVTPSRLKENFQLYDFELSEAEMKQMFSLNRDHRVYGQEITLDHPEYPFSIPF
ncbi:1,5-anhydro-D-fructose reductase-like [Haliotis rufescens]|uniref:1,5-anhydro-D-fructose reductase-like n=1 Tax=Haliotis rufescens TaxID=6454 RepID=UPI00201F8E75|nr:1,5-anhydro-D-fructose reductase-like [Haliotis rufescens]